MSQNWLKIYANRDAINEILNTVFQVDNMWIEQTEWEENQIASQNLEIHIHVDSSNGIRLECDLEQLMILVSANKQSANSPNKVSVSYDGKHQMANRNWCY